MLTMSLSLSLMGPVEWLTEQLLSTRSARRRSELLRKLALTHDPGVIFTIVPFLADAESRVRRAAILALLHYKEEARTPMLEILRDRARADLHPGAVHVLAGIIEQSRGEPR
jgi:HEAT repeat protein